MCGDNTAGMCWMSTGSAGMSIEKPCLLDNAYCLSLKNVKDMYQQMMDITRQANPNL